MAFFTLSSTSADVALQYPSIELLCLSTGLRTTSPAATGAGDGFPSNPRPSKKSASMDRLRIWDLSMEPSLLPGWAGGGPLGTSDGGAGGSSSSIRMTSRSGKRKRVSEWARRCWACWVGVSGISSRSAQPVGMGSLAKLLWPVMRLPQSSTTAPSATTLISVGDQYEHCRHPVVDVVAGTVVAPPVRSHHHHGGRRRDEWHPHVQSLPVAVRHPSPPAAVVFHFIQRSGLPAPFPTSCRPSPSAQAPAILRAYLATSMTDELAGVDDSSG
ncbi:serine carboxypeptidase-like 17 [Striga asiatica]|uniref:Serine carboxypeptidase-like 17 n=1 Tax=Striga asiatica TaxID=4170 RepID=A0A5A7PP07_STRAF|nr:serine carboxypeptidase-like 17 [Striga asiatica]